MTGTHVTAIDRRLLAILGHCVYVTTQPNAIIIMSTNTLQAALRATYAPAA